MSSALLERVRGRLVSNQQEATAPHVAAALRAEGLVLGDDAVLDLVSALRRELVGAGPLETLLREPGTTDVLVNGPSDIWVDQGEGLQRADVRFAGEGDVRRLAQRLAGLAGRRLDEASPFVDARLPDGSRLHCVIPPIATTGTVISIRVPRRVAFTLDELIEAGSLDEHGAHWLRSLIANRLAVLVSGGTGSGKTTILSTLLALVPHHERLVIVEDSAELDPEHPHVVRLQSRPPNVEGAGVVTLRDLVRQSLRMRPDRLIVGEVRGAEVVDLLAAMNTGHEGGCATVHANSPADVPARLEALGLMAGLDRHAVHALMAAGVDACVHLARRSDGRRTVTGIHVFERGSDALVRSIPALTHDGRRLVAAEGLRALESRLEGQ